MPREMSVNREVGRNVRDSRDILQGYNRTVFKYVLRIKSV